jgi:hypothetical protein
VGDFRQAINGYRPQRRRFTRNGGLTRPFGARHPPVDCRDEFLEPEHELARAYRHWWTPVGLALRRETFQISPQLPQRQYVLSSGVRAVVVIERDWHAGHTVGMLPAAVERG